MSLAVRPSEVAVVIITRNRARELANTLRHTVTSPEVQRVVVVDNASTDETPQLLARDFPSVVRVRVERNLGSAGRNLGVERAATPYVAFCDDDSWWHPASLDRAVALLDAHPNLALVTARVLVGPEEREDPVCRLMAESPLAPPEGIAGSRVTGFLACASVVRRDAFVKAGGFHPRFGVGGEEALLAVDLMAAGWDLAYVPELVVHHHPSPAARGSQERRHRQEVRNDLWVAWLRRTAPDAIRASVRAVAGPSANRTTRRGLLDAARGLGWVLRDRQVAPARVQRAVELVSAR